jgi:hypothetical protein
VRKLRCFQVGGFTVQDVLDEFNERRGEFGVADADILSVNALPSTSEIKSAAPDGSTQKPKVEVVIVYWSDK